LSTGDGVFSFGMMAEFEQSIKNYGPHIYRYLFWEAGMLGQVMYLEAEAVGIRATGYSHSFNNLHYSFSFALFLSDSHLISLFLVFNVVLDVILMTKYTISLV
jgi:hypothetical protein